MTPRERYRAVMRGEPVDRLPYSFGGPRQSTWKAWRKQGLTPEIERSWGSFTGSDPMVGFGKLNTQPIPAYPEQVHWERDNLREWTDGWGVRRIDAVNQPTEGFATRRYLEFPVKCLADFEAMRHRYDPTTPERLIPQPGENQKGTYNPDGYRVLQGGTAYNDPAHAERLNHGDAPSTLTVPGLYWTARDWAGFEGLSLLTYTEPACVHAMMEHWTQFIMTILDGPLSEVKIDQIILNEDMAYKHAAMLSPDMMREFMLPRYQRLCAFFREKGVDCVLMDTDGHCGQVIETMFPSGLDGVSPCEIASHNDPGDTSNGTPAWSSWAGSTSGSCASTSGRRGRRSPCATGRPGGTGGTSPASIMACRPTCRCATSSTWSSCPAAWPRARTWTPTSRPASSRSSSGRSRSCSIHWPPSPPLTAGVTADSYFGLRAAPRDVA